MAPWAPRGHGRQFLGKASRTLSLSRTKSAWALAPHASYVSQKVIMLHQSTVRLRVVLNTGFAVLREKNNRLCTSGELLLVAGRPVSPAYSVIAATMSLR